MTPEYDHYDFGEIDDAEPVTETWLRAVGFAQGKPCPLGYPPDYTITHGRTLLTIRPSHNPANGWNASIDEGGSWRGLRQTRGDLRRLCSALGIRLASPTPGQTEDS